jgi:DNA-binding NarL/FixJ family response regulator
MSAHVSNLGVFVAEDSQPVRDRLVELINEIDHVAVVGQARSVQGAVDGILSSLPDCILLDFHLDGGTAADVLRDVRTRHASATVIVLTNYVYPQYRRLCTNLGANLFLDKSAQIAHVTHLIADLAGRNARSCPSAPQPRNDHAER